MIILKKMSVLVLFCGAIFANAMETVKYDLLPAENIIGTEKNIRKVIADLIALNQAQTRQSTGKAVDNQLQPRERKAKL